MLAGPPVAEGAPSILDLFPDDVVSEGFTGTITDAAGHKRQYVDGKQVAGQKDGGVSPARASGADAGHDSATAGLPPNRRNFVSKGLGKLRELGFRVRLRTAKGFVVACEHKLAYAAHKVREIAVEAGRRRVPPMGEAGSSGSRGRCSRPTLRAGWSSAAPWRSAGTRWPGRGSPGPCRPPTWSSFRFLSSWQRTRACSAVSPSTCWFFQPD